MLNRIHKTIVDHQRFFLFVLLVFVFLVRLVVAGVILYPDRVDRALNTDQWGGIAKNIVDGYGYVGTIGHIKPEDAKPNSERGPVPVFFLAGLFWIFGYKLWVVMIANWMCDVGTAYILYRIAKILFPDRIYVPCLCILLWALYIPEITITNKTFAEPLYTLLLACHIWTILKLQQKLSWQIAILSGMLLAAAALSRPAILLFLPVVWGLLLLSKTSHMGVFDWRQLKRTVFIGVVLTCAFCVTLLPWAIRNYYVFDKFMVSGSLAGYNLIRENYFLNTERYVHRLMTRSEIDENIEKELRERGETLKGKSPIEKDLIFRQIAIDRIKAHPGRYLIVCGYRFLRLWFNVGFGVKPSIESYMVMTANGILLCLFVAAFFGFKEGWFRKSIPLLSVIFYTTMIHVPLTAQVRYIFPVMPYVLLFGTYSLIRLIEWNTSPMVFNGRERLSGIKL